MRTREIEAKLRKLGDTPDKVAAKLRSAKCRGQSAGASCPIAMYLKKLGCKNVYVGPRAATVNNKPVALPQATKDFIDKFDTSQYPDLWQDNSEDLYA